jgi:N-acetylglucosamine kinase-like BadF-type ATPase
MMYLGVDGGGTKTALCLVDEGGHVAAQTKAPSCYYFKEGIELVGRVLKEGIEDVCAQASVMPADIRYAFFGLPTVRGLGTACGSGVGVTSSATRALRTGSPSRG